MPLLIGNSHAPQIAPARLQDAAQSPPQSPLQQHGVQVEAQQSPLPIKTSSSLSSTSNQTLSARLAPAPLSSTEEDSMSWLNSLSSAEETVDMDPEIAEILNADRTALSLNNKRLGAGAYGEVYLVEHNGKPTAFKVANTEQGWKSLQKEAQIYARLEEHAHPNVISSSGIQEIDGVQGLAMEYVEGSEVDKILHTAEKLYKDNKLSHPKYWGTVQYIAKEALMGIQHLNEAGISHSDIKGGNLLFDTNSGHIRLFDFGRSGIVNEDQAKIGTPAYAAPEAIASFNPEEPDKHLSNEKQDAFAIGQMVYRAGEGAEHLFGANQIADGTAQTNALYEKLFELKEDGKAGSYRALTEAQTRKEAAQAGSFAVNGETAYVDFVNLSTLISTEERGSTSQLLHKPFLRDPLLQPDEAQATIRELVDYIKAERKKEIQALRALRFDLP